MLTLLKGVMLQINKPWKAGKKPGAKGAKKTAAWGSKGKGKKTLKRLHNYGSKKDSYDSKNKEDPK